MTAVVQTPSASLNPLRRSLRSSPPPTHLTLGHSGDDAWEVAARAPHPQLNAVVLGYVGLKGTIDLARERHLPSGEIEVLINLGDPYRVLQPSSGSVWTTHRGAAVIGVHDSCVLSEQTGAQFVLVVRLRPTGAHTLFDTPMHELANRFVQLDGLSPELARSLPSRLYDAPDWDTRFSIVDSIVAGRLDKVRTQASRTAWAWEKLRDADGLVSIRSLASEAGCSQKHLIAQFGDWVGVAPKVAARVIRFNRAVRLMQRGDSLDLAQIALECGYFDQSHFNRDFKAFAGCTPVELSHSIAGPRFRANEAAAR